MLYLTQPPSSVCLQFLSFSLSFFLCFLGFLFLFLLLSPPRFLLQFRFSLSLSLSLSGERGEGGVSNSNGVLRKDKILHVISVFTERSALCFLMSYLNLVLVQIGCAFSV